MTEDAFHGGAPWYDALSGGPRRLVRESPFLLGALARAPLPRVLDLACGTGIHALFLAEHGADVTACDLSPEMIACARAKRPHLRIAYEVADMRTPPRGPFGLAVCMGNSLSLLPVEDGVRACFAGVAAALAPGGLFALQLLNYANPALREPRERIETAEFAGDRVRARKTFTPEDDHTILHLEYSVLRKGESDLVTAETVLLRHWSREFLEETAAAAGLSLEECLGAFDGTPYDPATSTDLILLFRR